MRTALAIGLVLVCAWVARAGELSDTVGVASSPPAQQMGEGVGRWTFPVRGQVEPASGRFVEYTPKGWDGVTPLPLMVFLHGAGARTEVKDTIETLYAEFLLKLIREGKQFDAIVLCPQARGYWRGDAVDFLDAALAAYAGRFDVDRVYVTGLSSGGGGTWTAALERKSLLAAAVPVCGIRKPVDRDRELVDLPIWAFHNAHDPYQKVQYTRDHVDAIRAAGGRFIKYTEYDATPGKSHPGKDGNPVFPKCHAHAWETAYSDEATWTWLFKQRRGKPELSADPKK